jgi:hypothetical protein
MATHSLITVGTTASVRLTPIGQTHSGIDITIQNCNNIGYIYIGANENVSSTDYGYRLMPNHAWSIELNGQDHLYAIASLADMNVAIIKARLESGF